MRAAFSPSSLPTAASGLSPPARTISSTPGELPMVPAFSRSVSLFAAITRHCHTNIYPDAGQENSIAQPKQITHFASDPNFDHLSPFNC